MDKTGKVLNLLAYLSRAEPQTNFSNGMKMKADSRSSDDQLLDQLKKGDEQAFALIYDRCAPGMIDFASGRLASLEEARDLVHDLFVELWEKRHRVAINGSFRSYLFAATRYRVIDHIRRNIRKDYYAGMVRLLEAGADNSTTDHILYRDLHEVMDTEIGKLPPRTREIFRLSRYQHLSIKEIAGKLRLSDQTVRNQLSTALRLLRPKFEKLALIAVLHYLNKF